MPTGRQERTSPAAASSASHVLNNADVIIETARRVQRDMHEIIKFVEESKKSAGSALTQKENNAG